MIKSLLLILALSGSAWAGCPTTGTGLNLEIPAAGDSGANWAACIRRDLLKISTGTMPMMGSVSTAPAFGKIMVSTISGLNDSGVYISSATEFAYGVKAATATFTTGVFIGPAGISNIGDLDVVKPTTGAGDIVISRNDTTVTNQDRLGNLYFRSRDTSTGGAAKKCGVWADAIADYSSTPTDHPASLSLGCIDNPGVTVSTANLVMTNTTFMLTGDMILVARSSITTSGGFFGDGSGLTNLPAAVGSLTANDAWSVWLTQSPSAASSSTIHGLDFSTYWYRVETELSNGSNALYYLRCEEDSGVDYKFAGRCEATGGGATNVSGGTTLIPLTYNAAGRSVANYTLDSEFTLKRDRAVANMILFRVESNYYNSTPQREACWHSGEYQGAATVTKCAIVVDAGSMTGTVKVWRIPR